MTQKRKRRFIAGATCPECKAMDTIMVYVEHNVEKLACTQCGYSESQPEQSAQQASRPKEQVIGVFKPE